MSGETSPGIGYKQVHVERYTRRRVFYEEADHRRRFDRLSHVDSDAELDEAVKTKYADRGERWRVRKWYESVKSIVAVFILSVVEFTRVKILRRQTRFNTSQGYYRYGGNFWRFLELIKGEGDISERGRT